MGWWWRLVQFGFRLLYNEFAFTYDLVSRGVSLGAWRCWQRAALKYLALDADVIVLELAHGTGDLQLDLQSAGVRAIGYDLSPYMGDIARSKLLRHAVQPRLVRGKAQELPFQTAQFAAVICTFPSDFVTLPKTLKEVHRVLQPDGVFIIVPNAMMVGGGIIRRFLEWLYRVTGQRAEAAFDIGAYFEPYGFAPQMFQEPCPRSVAQVIVARRLDMKNRG